MSSPLTVSREGARGWVINFTQHPTLNTQHPTLKTQPYFFAFATSFLIRCI